MVHKAWNICTCLLNHGADSTLVFDYSLVRNWCHAKVDTLSHLQTFLKHDDLVDTLRFRLIGDFPGDLKSFTRLTHEIWPHCAFHHLPFGDRLTLARYTAMSDFKNPSGPEIFRYISRDLPLKTMCGSDMACLLQSLAHSVGTAVWRDSDIAERWYSTILSTLCRLDGERVVQWMTESKESSSPLELLFYTSFIDRPSTVIRKHKFESRLRLCRESLRKWVEMLERCGIDLEKYGALERHKFSSKRDANEFFIFRDAWNPESRYVNGWLKLRLIDFQYGRRVEDWFLWWSDPTDELVGDFWREIEPEPLKIPGSWVD